MFVSASVWGLFWLPLREIDRQGLTGPWVILAINLVPLLFFAPITIMRWSIIRRHLKEASVIGIFIGAGLVFYSLGLIYTSIMRATLLYYLTPIWSTLFGIVILSEQVNWRRWVAIGLGFGGLILILSAKSSVAGSLNVGDLMGLLSGIFWGAGAAYTRLHNNVAPVDTASSIYFFSCLIGAALFSLVFKGFKGDEAVQYFLTNLPGGELTALLLVMLVLFLLGFILDFIEITFVVIPIVGPVLLMMGFDPVWLGIMIAINLQTSFLTPPFGFALFYLRGVTDISTRALYRGVMPFIVLQIIMLVILYLFPGLIDLI